MGPKINGSSVAELVASAVERQLEKKFGDYNNLLTRIASLEEELAQCRQSSITLQFHKSFSKSDIIWVRATPGRMGQ